MSFSRGQDRVRPAEGSSPGAERAHCRAPHRKLQCRTLHYSTIEYSVLYPVALVCRAVHWQVVGRRGMGWRMATPAARLKHVVKGAGQVAMVHSASDRRCMVAIGQLCKDDTLVVRSQYSELSGQVLCNAGY